VSTASAPPRPAAGMRIDQRVLGAGTTARFIMLLTLFAVSSIQLLSGLISQPIFPGIIGQRDYGPGCLLAAGVNPGGGVLTEALATLRSPASGAYQACEARYGWNPPWWLPYAAAGLLLVAAAALYLALPAWKGRRSRIVPVAELDATGDLRRLLAGLTAAARLTRQPRFVIDPAAATTSAVVFGRPGRYTVCLPAGLVARRSGDPAGFRAVVLHELAHIRNRDVGITYATVALWRIYLIAALLPGAASAGWLLLSVNVLGTDAHSVFRSAADLLETRSLLLSAFTIVLVYLARADILRSRETYADLDAVRWGADAAAWQRPAAAPRPGRRAGGAGRGWAAAGRRGLASFLGLWRTHPGWAQRERSLADTSALFGVSSLQMFLTGAVASISSYELTLDLVPFLPGSAWQTPVIPWLIAGLVSAIAGVALWRAVTHAVLAGRRVPSGLRAGAWLGAGLIAGELAREDTVGPHWLPQRPWFLLPLLLIAVVTCCWAAGYAELSVRTWRGRSVRPAMLAGLAALWPLLALSLQWWQLEGWLLVTGFPLSTSVQVRTLVQAMPGPVIPGHGGTLSAITSIILMTPPATAWFLTLAGAALWLLPLLVWARRPAAGPPAWAVRAAPPAPELRPATGRGSIAAGADGPDGLPCSADLPRPAGLPDLARLPRLRRVLLAAFLGGAASWAATAGVMAYMHSWHAPFSQRFGSFLLIYLGWLTVAVGAGSVAGGTLAATIVSRYRLIVALVAAGTAALAGFAGVFVLEAADGCAGPLTTMALSCGWRPVAGWQAVKYLPEFVLGLGPFIIVPAVLLIRAAAGLAARLAGRREQRRRAGPGQHPPPGVAQGHRPGRARPGAAPGMIPPARPPRLAARRGGIAVICAAAVVITVAVSGFPYSSGSVLPPMSLDRFTAGVSIANPVSPTLRNVQVAAWLKFGGTALIPRFAASLGAIGTDAQVLAGGMARGLHSAAFQKSAATMERGCAELDQDVQDAQRYFPVPDPPQQRAWAAALAALAKASAGCRRGLAQRDPALIAGSLRLALRAGNTLAGATQQIVAEARRACLACA
jgi:Zn-dependent protease with chaperone function